MTALLPWTRLRIQEAKHWLAFTHFYSDTFSLKARGKPRSAAAFCVSYRRPWHCAKNPALVQNRLFLHLCAEPRQKDLKPGNEEYTKCLQSPP